MCPTLHIRPGRILIPPIIAFVVGVSAAPLAHASSITYNITSNTAPLKIQYADFNNSSYTDTVTGQITVYYNPSPIGTWVASSLTGVGTAPTLDFTLTISTDQPGIPTRTYSRTGVSLYNLAQGGQFTGTLGVSGTDLTMVAPFTGGQGNLYLEASPDGVNVCEWVPRDDHLNVFSKPSNVSAADIKIWCPGQAHTVYGTGSWTIATLPEPESWVLLGIGLIGIVVYHRRYLVSSKIAN